MQKIMIDYDPSPAYPFMYGEILSGVNDLLKTIQANLARVWLFDGHPAIDWEKISEELAKLNTEFELLDFTVCRKSSAQFVNLFSDLEIQDSQYFRYFQGSIEDLIDEKKLKSLLATINDWIQHGKRIICFGSGSGLLKLTSSILALIDSPRVDISANIRSGKHSLFGPPFLTPEASCEYFDNPIMKRHIQSLLHKFDFYIDFSSSNGCVFVDGTSFKKNIAHYSSRPFRAKPVFYEKTWGGQWLKKNLGVGKSLNNVAGSFEFAQKENDVNFHYQNTRIRIPLEYMIQLFPEEIMGNHVYREFGSEEFPLRLNLTDTIGGGDLSCQVHPKGDFTWKNFGVQVDMDEKYFVIHAEDNARINLGLKDRINIDAFADDVRKARKDEKSFSIDKYIQEWPAIFGDVFFIPPGTIHNIGAGNLVMEVIASNTLFTFRLYDYLRRTKDGRLRPLQIDEAWQVLNPSRTTSMIKKFLLPKFSHPQSGIKEEFSVPQYEGSFTSIKKLVIRDSFSGDTRMDRFQLLTLVKGENVLLEWGNGSCSLNYLETTIIPGSTGPYRISSSTNKTSTLLNVSVI